MARAAVEARKWALLRARSGIICYKTRSGISVFSLEVRWRRSVVVVSGRPSSTSAHSAGVEREKGLCRFL